MNVRDLFIQSFETVVSASHPDFCMQRFIPDPPKGRLIVIGAGKATAAMAVAFENAYKGDIEGVIVTRYGHALPTRKIKIIEAAHPVPDLAGQNAVREIMKLLETAGKDDLIISLISGGGSSLLSHPVSGVSFEQLQTVQKQLLGSGASIHEMNIVRKHLNSALGGGLVRAAPNTRMITLAISDVVGDDPSTIASGPTVADSSTLSDAWNILKKYNINAADEIKRALDDPENETPKEGDPVFKDKEYHLIATPKNSLTAAQKFWQEAGFETYILNAEIEGDSENAASLHSDHIKEICAKNQAPEHPVAILSGGETTMTLNSANGKGGPNAHFILCAALRLAGMPRIYGMACDTDGIDGNANYAGAIITPDTLERAKSKGLDAQDFLTRQDSYSFFEQLGDAVKTGPTHTNVNDYRVFLRLP